MTGCRNWNAISDRTGEPGGAQDHKEETEQGGILYDRLQRYADCGIYPFHMPGHKRHMTGVEPYRMDITEIDGFDDLHHPTGAIRAAQERAARLFGGEEAFYLVNGSTCGLLAAVCAASERGGRVLVARNCHKSVYHALRLKELSARYLLPEVTEYGLCGQITPDSVRRALRGEPELRAVILTSPTYDGMVSDIAAIAGEVHAYGLPLIVDQAHGAHFGISEEFPESAIRLGADAVVISLHKTLPSLTQTALLLLAGERLRTGRVREYLDIFETSSPSYVLMGSIDRCVGLIGAQGRALARALQSELRDFYVRIKELRCLHVLRPKEVSPKEAFAFDASKLLILTGDSGMDGFTLQRILREEFAVETEMACAGYVLALCSISDEREGFARLAEALEQIDERLAGKKAALAGTETAGRAEKRSCSAALRLPERVLQSWEPSEREQESVPYEEAVGRISAGYLVPYPPGIPLAVPGERVDTAMVEAIAGYRRMEATVEGLSDSGRIDVVIS